MNCKTRKDAQRRAKTPKDAQTENFETFFENSSAIQRKFNWNSAPWRAGAGDGRGAWLITFLLKERWSKRFFAFFAGGGAWYKVVICETRGGNFFLQKMRKNEIFSIENWKFDHATELVSWPCTRNTQHATNARNARTQQTRSTPNKIRKHAKSRSTAENIAYRTNQLPVGAQDFAPIVRLHPIAAKTWACYCTLLKLEVCLESQ